MTMVAERAFRRDRVAVGVELVVITALACAYTVHLSRTMTGMGADMSAQHMRVWSATDFVLTFVMWTVMQIAMMTPSATPMVLLFAKFGRQRQELRSPFVATSAFLLGYLIVWAGYSALATMAQWALSMADLVSPMMASATPVAGGALLIAAGVFNLTPLKNACLDHCRSPWGFFLSDWREGTRGAAIMGLRHGAFCVACCSLLMVLMFVAGVMNLLWAAGLTLYVVIEKVLPGGDWLSRVAGVFAIGWGASMVVAALV